MEEISDTIYIGINIANLTNIFLRRDGGNTAIGAFDMNGIIIKNGAEPLSHQDVTTKNYVHKNAITTAGCVVSGDIKVNLCSDLVRFSGCNDLTTCKKFTLARLHFCWDQTQMRYHITYSIYN